MSRVEAVRGLAFSKEALCDWVKIFNDASKFEGNSKVSGLYNFETENTRKRLGWPVLLKPCGRGHEKHIIRF